MIFLYKRKPTNFQRNFHFKEMIMYRPTYYLTVSFPNRFTLGFHVVQKSGADKILIRSKIKYNIVEDKKRDSD